MIWYSWSSKRDAADEAGQILEDYSSQLTHLAKELEQLQKDWKEWSDGSPDATKVDGHA